MGVRRRWPRGGPRWWHRWPWRAWEPRPRGNVGRRGEAGRALRTFLDSGQTPREAGGRFHAGPLSAPSGARDRGQAVRGACWVWPGLGRWRGMELRAWARGSVAGAVGRVPWSAWKDTCSCCTRTGGLRLALRPLLQPGRLSFRPPAVHVPRGAASSFLLDCFQKGVSSGSRARASTY